MKKLFLLIMFIGLGTYVQAQETIKWMTFNEALELQKKKPKKIFMDVYTDWCGPCKMLDRNTFQNEDVAKYVNENFYAVKFNAEGTEKIDYKDFTYTNPGYVPNKRGRNSQHQFTQQLSVRGYPTLVFFDEKGDVITPVVGYKTPKQLEIYLKMVANDDYKDVTTAAAWEQYQQDFKGTFRN